MWEQSTTLSGRFFLESDIEGRVLEQRPGDFFFSFFFFQGDLFLKEEAGKEADQRLTVKAAGSEDQMS